MSSSSTLQKRSQASRECITKCACTSRTTDYSFVILTNQTRGGRCLPDKPGSPSALCWRARYGTAVHRQNAQTTLLKARTKVNPIDSADESWLLNFKEFERYMHTVMLSRQATPATSSCRSHVRMLTRQAPHEVPYGTPPPVIVRSSTLRPIALHLTPQMLQYSCSCSYSARTVQYSCCRYRSP